MTEEQLAVIDELALEISCCSDPEEKAEFERTLEVCREVSYGLAEGIISCEEDPDGELLYFPVAA